MNKITKNISFETDNGLNVAERGALMRAISRLRQRSLAASRCGDYKTVAQLTVETALLNEKLLPKIGREHPLYAEAA